MATRNADVNLIVRAKTEGEQAISSLASAISHLINDAGAGKNTFAEFGKTVAALDKAAAGLGAAQEKVASSATGQAAAVHAASASIKEQQDRVDTLRRGFELLSREADKAFIGPRRNGLADLLKLAKSEMADAERQLNRYTSAYDRNLTALQTSRSGLLGLRRTTSETADAQASAAAAVELTTRALNEQTAAAQRAAAAQNFYNAKGGPASAPASANGATTDALVEHFQRLEVEASKVRAAIDPVGAAVERYEARIKDVRAAALNGIIGSDDAIVRERQLRFELTQTIDKIAQGAARIREERRNAVSEYQALINGLTGVTGKRATESGASYEALDADMRAREAAVRAREAADTRAAADAAGGVGRPAATDAANGLNRATFSALDAREAEAEAQALREAAFAYQQFETRARAGAQALRDAEAAAKSDAAAVQSLRDKIDPVAAIQRNLNEQIAETRRLAGPAGLSTEELAKAEAHLAQEAKEATDALNRRRRTGSDGAFKASIFGLKPYELQNLSYQINDVVTGLASGQRLGQVVAQQGGQILQLFPKAGGAIVAALTSPAILAFGASVGLIALGIARAADNAERLRNATADLGRRANGSDYQAGNISEQERELKRLGATAEDARKALGTFVDAGVPAQSLQQFGRVAKETAEILGVDLPSAAQQVATAFTGGYQAISELDNRLNFLTGAQREHIRQLFEEGHAQEAQTLALNIYTQKMDSSAAQARGPWASANRDLTKSWDDLLESFANTRGIKDAAGFVNVLASAVKGLSAAVNDAASGGDLTELKADMAEIVAIKAALRDPKNHPFADDIYGGNLTPDKLRERLGVRISNYNEAARRQKQPTLDGNGDPVAPASQPAGAGAPGTKTATTQGDTPQARQRADRIAAINDEDELQRLRDAGAVRLLTAAEKVRREQLAGAIAFRQEQDAAVGAIRRQSAAAHETASIQKETKAAEDRAKAEARQAQQERENTIKRYLQRIGAAEGGEGPNRAGSSAVGIGQFTRDTFIGTYRRANPGTSLGDSQIADLRRDPEVAQQILDVFTRQNAQFLTNLHQTISGANLYLIHFLGQGTGGRALRAAPGTPIDQIITARGRNGKYLDPNANAVLSQNRGYLFDKEKGRYRTRAELQSYLGNRVGDAAGIGGEDQGSVLVALETREARKKQDSQKKQDELNLSIQQGNEDRQRGIDVQKAEFGHDGVDLLDIQRTQAGTQAVEELRQRVEALNRALPPGAPLITVTPEQVAEVRQLAEAFTEAQQAKQRLNERLKDVQQPISDLQERKQQLQQQAEFLRSVGDNSGAEKIEAQIRNIGGAIGEAIDKAIAFYQALTQAQQVSLGITDEAQLANIINGLRLAKEASQEWGRVAGLSAKDVAQAFAGSAVNAFTNFINKVAAGKNVFKSFAEGIREFAATFLQSIAQMILQLLAFAAVVTILRALGVPVPANAFGGAAVHHTGGIAGQGTGQRRQVSPLLFAGAMRYHTGGIIGLAPDEQPAILRKGEEVLTEADPRHRNNGGGGGAAAGAKNGDVTFINVSDPVQAMEQALRTPQGHRVFIQYASDNQSSIKTALGSR